MGLMVKGSEHFCLRSNKNGKQKTRLRLLSASGDNLNFQLRSLKPLRQDIEFPQLHDTDEDLPHHTSRRFQRTLKNSDHEKIRSLRSEALLFHMNQSIIGHVRTSSVVQQAASGTLQCETLSRRE